MNLIRIFRYLFGYVTFSTIGGFTERFINLCSVRDIFLFDVSYSGNSFTAKILLKDFKKLRDVAKRSGVKIKVKRKDGLRYFLKRNKEKSGFAIGAIIFSLFLLTAGNFVWTIDVKGNNTISKEEILNDAKELGLYVGRYKKTFPAFMKSSELAKMSKGKLDWASINIKGSRAEIEVREHIPSIVEEDNLPPSNLIADFEGVLLSIEVNGGIKKALEGNGIKRGDVLISGIGLKDDLTLSLYPSKGKCTALHEKEIEEVYPKNIQTLKIKKARKKFTLFFLGIKLPINPFFVKNADYKDEYYLEYNGLNLPLGIIIETKIQKEKKSLSAEEIALYSRSFFSNKFYNENKNTNILNYKTEINENKKEIIIKAKEQCIDFVGKTQIIVVEGAEN